MPRYLNPDTLPKPLSRYTQAVVLGPYYKRVVISGQVGVRADGGVSPDLREQMEQAFDNALRAIAAADLTVEDIVKITCYSAVPGSVGVYRDVRDSRLGKATPAATYIEVSGLAAPEYLVEIEAEAVREAPLRA